MIKTTDGIHKTVLLQEVVLGLSIKSGEIVLDATINGGGHSVEVAKRYGDTVTIIGLDEDKVALSRADLNLKDISAKYHLQNQNFKNVDEVLKTLNVAEIDRAMFDLGISSDQLEASGRGFSFQKDEPLLMTLKDNPNETDLTAYDVLNTFSEDSLKTIIKGFGEEPFSGRIARHIVEHREVKPIETSKELADIITNAVPFFKRKGKIHPATKTFQAIRIATNGELDSIHIGLEKVWNHLKVGGRIAVISFHSLEDRIVKNYFRSLVGIDKAILINKKPIVPSDEEIKNNPRSRSAKLRIIEKI